MNNDFEQKTQALEALKDLCDATEQKNAQGQDDQALIAFLKQEYPKVTRGNVIAILKVLEHKKTSHKISTEERKSLDNKLIAKAFLSDINPIDKKGKFIGYEKLKHRISQKKNILKTQK